MIYNGFISSDGSDTQNSGFRVLQVPRGEIGFLIKQVFCS